MNKRDFIALTRDIVNRNPHVDNYFLSSIIFNKLIGKNGINDLVSKISKHVYDFPKNLNHDYLLCWDDVLYFDLNKNLKLDKRIKVRIICYHLDGPIETWLIEINGSFTIRKSEFFFTTYYGSDGKHVHDIIQCD